METTRKTGASFGAVTDALDVLRLAPPPRRYSYGSPPSGFYIGSSIGASQLWCLQTIGSPGLGSAVTVAPCDSTNSRQQFSYDVSMRALLHTPTGLCLDAAKTPTPTPTPSPSPSSTPTTSSTPSTSFFLRQPGCVLQKIPGTLTTPCYAGSQWAEGPASCSQTGSLVVYPGGYTTTTQAMTGVAYYWSAVFVNASLDTSPFRSFPEGAVIQFMDGCDICAINSPTPSGCQNSCGVNNFVIVCPPSTSPTPSQSSTPSPTQSATIVCGSIAFSGYLSDLVGPPGFPALGTSDWTIECWAKQTSATPAYQRLFSFYPSGATSWASDFIEVSIQSNIAAIIAGGTVANVQGYDPSLYVSVWQHWAAVRSGTTLSLYINGALASSITAFAGSIGDASGIFHVGGYDPSAPLLTQWAGNIANFRVVVGALYT